MRLSKRSAAMVMVGSGLMFLGSGCQSDGNRAGISATSMPANADHPNGDHSKSDHPNGDHSKSDHPKGDHSNGDHPK